MCSNGCKDFAKVKWSRTKRRAGRGAVEMKVKKLQRLVPGGQGLNPDRLFLRTADYILHLRLQVNVLQTLSKIYKP
ncbi:transcription factor par2 [Fagus crenata]|uniref:BHLH domain-containing protein n=1 Tax=Fagus sylvatica TaxID=28930 RepID=A0A2N9GPQ6_FAGSY